MWSNPRKGEPSSPTPRCSSYRKGNLRVANFTFYYLQTHGLVHATKQQICSENKFTLGKTKLLANTFQWMFLGVKLICLDKIYNLFSVILWYSHNTNTSRNIIKHNLRTHFFIKIYLSKGLMFLWCVRDGWWQGQTAILTQLLLLTIARCVIFKNPLSTSSASWLGSAS